MVKVKLESKEPAPVKVIEPFRRVPENDPRLQKFKTIKRNIYLNPSDKIIDEDNKDIECDCVPDGSVGCLSDCINRLLYFECSSQCALGSLCDNQNFKKRKCAPMSLVETEKKGFGVIADAFIPADSFLTEFVAEIMDDEQFKERKKNYNKSGLKHFYFMSLRKNAIMDATVKGNIARYINHSCDPNSIFQVWQVDGESRIGFFSLRDIEKGEELTIDYQYSLNHSTKSMKCYCGAAKCRGWLYKKIKVDENEESPEELSDNEDTKIEEEIQELIKSGLKNKAHTIALSRLVVRAKSLDARSRLLDILINGELPCRRLFLDFHGLKILQNWMFQIKGSNERSLWKKLLEALDILPITNKTALRTSKVLDHVKKLKKDKNLKSIAESLLAKWEALPEDFRIPKKIKQEKEEDEEEWYDQQPKSSSVLVDQTEEIVETKYVQNIPMPLWVRPKSSHYRAAQHGFFDRSVEGQSMFNEHKRNCAYFGLPDDTLPINIPVRVNQVTGQFYGADGRRLSPPPLYKDCDWKPVKLSKDPAEYHLPAVKLPENWKFAIDSKGRIYYYHKDDRVSQWEPPKGSESDEDLGTPDEDESSTDTVDSEEEELQELLEKLQKKKQKIENRKAEKENVKIKEEPRDEPKASVDDKHSKQRFMHEIKKWIAQYLKPYVHESCIDGRITTKEDYFNLHSKLTMMVFEKEEKHCQKSKKTMQITHSVVEKTKRLVETYMSQFKGNFQEKPSES